MCTYPYEQMLVEVENRNAYTHRHACVKEALDYLQKHFCGYTKERVGP